MQGPSQYAGFAAVMVFGVGLMLTGHIWAGLGVVTFDALAMVVVLWPTVPGKIFALALGALICSGAWGYFALRNELSGTATYETGRHRPAQTVTRQDSPAKFREVVNFRWGLSAFFLMASVGGFTLCHKLRDYGEEYV